MDAVMRSLSKACFLAVAVAVLGCGGNDSNSVTTVFGESQTIGALTARTSATLVNGQVTEAVTIVPRGMLTPAPAQGTGPAGSFLSLDYPAEVQNTTFFNHIEVHYNPAGHPPMVFQVPHFDIHAYGITEAQVRAIPVPDTVAPAANRLPTGYMYDGVDRSIPEMGVHAMRHEDMADPFRQAMILGYSQGSMIFIEPMINANVFINKENVTQTILVPPVLGRATRYPTRFHATYDAGSDSYRFVYDQFVNVN